ncbi:MAG: DUF1275 domain-containing protein [Lachnospiraceae bacterium]|nr:DUF1275 domain-containing protein [Lachnospiraceae bacterium]
MMKKRDVLVGALLCFAGGSIDGYSFVMRGGVLATAQTANLLLLGIHLSNANINRALSYLVPILCFMMGTYLAKLAYDKLFTGNMIRWQEGVLLTEIVVFIAIGFLKENVSDMLVNSGISFFSAMQYCAFRSFGDNAPYATVFSTGNMRSLIDNLYEGIMRRDAASLKRTAGYGIMLVSFASGAAGSNLLCRVVTYRACWLVSTVLLSVLILIRVISLKSKEIVIDRKF